VMMICNSASQLSKCIQVVEDWALANGMSLNKQKSGIVPFYKRRTKARNIGDDMNGIPILEEYKYLGTIMDRKLTLSSQLKCIEEKARFTHYKLFPYLKIATADSRRDMWQLLIVPLFNAALALINFEPSIRGKNAVLLLWKKLFKMFLRIPSATSNNLLEEMASKDLSLMSTNYLNSCQIKWEARKNYINPPPRIPIVKQQNPLRGVPNEWCKLIRSQYTPCPKCPREILNYKHAKYIHNLDIKPIWSIWKEIKAEVGSNQRREFIIPKLRSKLESYLSRHKEIIANLGKANKRRT
jgi:hypothetical protein